MRRAAIAAAVLAGLVPLAGTPALCTAQSAESRAAQSIPGRAAAVPSAPAASIPSTQAAHAGHKRTATGQTTSKPAGSLTEAERIAILRQLIAVAGTARLPLPVDKKGVNLSAAGEVLNASHVEQSLIDHGPADQPGDRVVITGIEFKHDRLVFALNGGPIKTHWWDHVELGMGGAMNPMNQLQRRKSHGAQITLHFPGGVPGLTPAEVKADLEPLIDWAPARVAQVMVQPLPAPVKTAIASHHVLVGMNRAMVIATMGRTNQKIGRTGAGGVPYENWIYGHPPQPTVFVRMEGGRVVRVTTWHSDGTKTVESTPDPAFTRMVTIHNPYTAGAGAAPAADNSQDADAPRPTLRRPGDAPAGTSGPGMGLPPGQSQLPEGAPPAGQPPFPGTPNPGTPGAGMPNPGMPGSQMPGAGLPNPGADSGPDSGMPGSGMPGGWPSLPDASVPGLPPD